MTLPPGTRLDSYEILAPIGAGGMGEVYRAHDARLARDVAIKILPEAVAADPDRLARFEREAKTLASLNHPGIVTLYSIEESAGVRFLAMELIEGQALDALIPASGLPLARLFEIAVPLADALAAAHGKGIVHRDLKPANVMVDAGGRVKVLDFGLAKAAPAAASGASMTRLSTEVGLVVGTVPYMSPEQIEGRVVDPRGDVFSFGVVLYEMAAGQRPFDADSSPALMSAILRDQPVPLADRRADLPEHLGRIVRRCLEKVPANRYPSMRDVHRELRDLQHEASSGIARKPASGAGHAPRQSFRIAVLPFKGPAGDDQVEALAEGLVEDVTAGLLKFPHLVVSKDPAIARYHLEGSIRKSGPTVRVKVQLVDVESGGAPMWAETYSRDLSSADLFAIQDEVTDRVVATVADVHGVLVRSMTHALRETSLDALTAHELLLRYWSYQGNPKPDEHARLRAALEAMAAREPNNAEVHAARSWLYSHEDTHMFNRRPDPRDRARAAAQRATELDPLGQHGWQALALAHFFDRDREGVLQALERTLALNPRNANAIAGMGFLLAHMGEHERGYALVRRAMELNPQHPGWYHFVEVDYHFLRGEFSEALAAIKRINMPEMVWLHVLTASVCVNLGRLDEARAAVRLAEQMLPALGNEADVAAARSRWFWSPEFQAPFHEAYLKARALL